MRYSLLVSWFVILLGSPPGSFSQTETERWNDHHVSWSPDGSYLAIDSDRTGNGEVFLIRPNGSSPTQITWTPGEEVAPVWSPDGEWLAVQLDVDDETDGWLIRADGSGRAASHDGRHRRWSHDVVA